MRTNRVGGRVVWRAVLAGAAALSLLAVAPAERATASGGDCGLGRDAAVEAVSLPFQCSGVMDGFDDVDSFTFSFPEGRRARMWVEVGNLQGYSLKLTSPSGFQTHQSEHDMLSTDEQGTWRLDARGDGDVMSYVLHIVEIGQPAPPVLSLAYDPVAHQGDFHPIEMTAVDPNGETLQYTAAWGGGSFGIYPTHGRAQSGDTVTAFRKLLGEELSNTFTISVMNRDGLTDSETVTLSVRLHNDCGLGNPVYEAPPTAAGMQTMPATCVGTVGYGLPEPTPFIDRADAYRSPLGCLMLENCKLRVTMTTSPGLAATLVLDNYILGEHRASCGAKGCTTSVETVGPTYPHADFPRVFVQRVSGKGEYTLHVERVPIV